MPIGKPPIGLLAIGEESAGGGPSPSSLLPIFPTLAPLGWSVHKKPIMASRVTKAISGRETQLACAVYPRWSFILTYGGNSWLRDQTQNIVPDDTLQGFNELQLLSGLFLFCKASYGEFYYSDPDDCSRLNQAVGIGNPLIPLTTFPLFYTWGSGPFSPSFIAPVGGIATIDVVYFDGTPISPAAYTMDATNTKIIFATPPGVGVVITADFHFYFRCRFLEDNLVLSQFDRNLWEIKEVRFESVKQ